MSDWSDIEVELIVADYLSMLQTELAGKPFSKTVHRKRLHPLLNNRSDGSIEFKHQNISAVLVKNGFPYINGYKPRWNFQALLEEKVLSYINANPIFINQFESFATREIQLPETQIKFANWLVEPPKPSNLVKDPKVGLFVPTKTNFIELEQRNTSIGMHGEKLVYEYEKWRLDKAGYSKLSKEVRWVSRDQGDGAGYDILSKDISGEDKFIEVKSTTLGKDTPIFFTKRENDFSEIKDQSFHLYRVFELNKTPKVFTRTGRFGDFCSYEATQFKGMF